jgi:hypothetical protein
VRLRTDAVGEQGRVSYIDLPYNITSISGESTGQLVAASTPAAAATPVSSVGPIATVAGPAATSAGHTYAVTLSPDGTTATFTGDASSDTLVFSASGGLIEHNRYSAGDPGFTSDFDFDSTQSGVQTLAAASNSRIIVNLGSGSETVVLGTSIAPASDLLAQFTINNFNASDTLIIDDSSNTTALDYRVDGDTITTTLGTLNIQLGGTPMGGGIFLTTGRALTSVDVLATRAGEPVTLDTAFGQDVVTIGDGSVQNILGNVTVENTNSFSSLIVDDSQAPAFSGSVNISATGITGLAPASILYSTGEIDSLEVYGGTNDPTYNVSTSMAGSFVYLDTGPGANQVVVGDNGVIDDASFPGQVLLDGNASSEVVLDNSAGGPRNVETDLIGLEGLNSTGIDFSHFGNAVVSLGNGSNNLTVFNTIVGTAFTFNMGDGDGTVHVNALNTPLTVNTQDGSDSIVIAANPALITSPITINGGSTARPGDQLLVELQGVLDPQLRLSGPRSGQ